MLESIYWNARVVVLYKKELESHEHKPILEEMNQTDENELKAYTNNWVSS